MSRISRHQMFMQVAEVASRRSTCFRRNVGTVIVCNRNIIGIGYNGPPSGDPHCTGNGCATDGKCTRSVHAEVNALDRSRAPTHHSNLPWSMYCTESPCPACANEIIDSPVGSVFYLNQYRLVEGLDMLVAAGRRVWRMTPSGMIINYATGELVEVME